MLSGSLSVFEFTNGEPSLLNTYSTGKSCADPELNLSVPFTSQLKQTSPDMAKVFFLASTSYSKVYGDVLNKIWSDRHDKMLRYFPMFVDWEFT